MRDYVTIGPVPNGEECEQLGPEYNPTKALFENRLYAEQLIRQFGEEPAGAAIKVMKFNHDFGTYSEVVCWFDESLPKSEEYAYMLEEEAPEFWDSESKKKLEDFMSVLENYNE